MAVAIQGVAEISAFLPFVYSEYHLQSKPTYVIHDKGAATV